MRTEKTRKKSGTEPIDVLPPDDVVFGRSAIMKEARQRAEKTAATNVPVLLNGQGGTGKEVLARWIHNHSPWCNGNFVKVNCAAIPETLLEGELFGYEKGAFTGAYTSKPGRVELAHEGTLFLDDVADLSLALQSKLLHFLQDGHFTRIGDELERAIETRLVCATKRDLVREIEAGRFRLDLYYRINVVQIKLPRLRERQEDIPLLAEYFLDLFQGKFAKKAEPLGPETVQYLQNLDWPGNIRELSNGIARHVLIGAEATTTQESTARRRASEPLNSTPTGVVPLKQMTKNAVRDFERRVILKALRANQWNRRRAAKDLRISYRTLLYEIREMGLSSKGPQKQTPKPCNEGNASIPSSD